ncbi:MAG: hypothetical protein WBN18_08710 [Flavobacteriaceae bacterium]
MKKINWTLAILIMSLLLVSCSDDEENTPIVPNAGTLNGGPFTFVVDGIPDMVSGVSLSSTGVIGTMRSYVVTDESRSILGLPPTISDLEGVDFDEAGEGICFIYHIAYEPGLEGLATGMNLSNLNGLFAISNAVTVNRGGLDAGMLIGGPFTFTIDGVADMVNGVLLDEAMLAGENRSFVITDADGNILGLPPTLVDLEGVDFDGAGVGVCFIYHLTYGAGLQGLESGNNLADLEGPHALSNSIEVNRLGLDAGELSGGPFTFTVDGKPDMVASISLDETGITGSIQNYVITDDMGNILGLPPTLAAVMGVDFDGAGVGTCFIYHLTYEPGLQGRTVGANISDLNGNYGLSNAITVNRLGLNAGSLSGGPFTFTVDGSPDMVSGIVLDETNISGTLSSYVITDDMGNILGLPPTLMAVEGVDFDAAGAGVCYIYHITYEEGLDGLMAGENLADLNGFFGLSNLISVTRNLD